MSSTAPPWSPSSATWPRTRRSGSTSCSTRADQRVYEELRRDDDVAVWLICWMDDHDTGFHDHDLSRRRGRGRRRARSPRTGSHSAVRRSRATFGEGEAFHFSAADIHRVRHTGDAPAVTIHAYSPPLWRMGAYEILAGGELRRHSLSYAEELRPLS